MRKKKASRATRDGAFPTPFDASYESSRESSNDDLRRPMCGQVTLNKILAVGSPARGSKSVERASLLPDQSQTRGTYKSLPYDVSPMKSINIRRANVDDTNDSRAKKSRSFEILEFPIMDDAKDDGSSISSISLNTVKQSGSRPSLKMRSKPTEVSSNDDTLVDCEMIQSMQDIIMQQHGFIHRLGLENEQYRENMVLLQELVTSLEKEQDNQKKELQKLHVKRHSFEAEAASLREEIKTLRLQLMVKKFTGRGKSAKGWEQGTKQAASQPSFLSDHTELKQESFESCTELQEIQASGVELYEFVSNITLGKPMSSWDHMHASYSSEKLAANSGYEEEEKRSSDSPTRNHRDKGNAFSRGKSG